MRSRSSNTGLRALIVGVVALAVVLLGSASGQAMAADGEPTTTQSYSATSATPFRPGGPSSFSGPDFTWSGIVFKFNHTETYYIGASAGLCALIVGKLPSVFAKVASLACGLLTWYAGTLLYQGRCLKLTFGYNPVTPSMYPEGWSC